MVDDEGNQMMLSGQESSYFSPIAALGRLKDREAAILQQII
ncbi:hypothetical protein [Paenibacillus baekrokdamisoli]|nr:hypothetical protein [Paenibacillus baekrokdamisoli]